MLIFQGVLHCSVLLVPRPDPAWRDFRLVHFCQSSGRSVCNRLTWLLGQHGPGTPKTLRSGDKWFFPQWLKIGNSAGLFISGLQRYQVHLLKSKWYEKWYFYSVLVIYIKYCLSPFLLPHVKILNQPENTSVVSSIDCIWHVSYDSIFIIAPGQVSKHANRNSRKSVENPGKNHVLLGMHPHPNSNQRNEFHPFPRLRLPWDPPRGAMPFQPLSCANSSPWVRWMAT